MRVRNNQRICGKETGEVMSRRAAKVYLRPQSEGWFASVRYLNRTRSGDWCFCYDTAAFPMKAAAKAEARAFCAWKGLRIAKWEERWN